MNIAQFVNSFNDTYVDKRFEDARITFYISCKYVSRRALMNDAREVAGFVVAPYSDGSIAVYIHPVVQ